jgi:hypothetical protein
VKNKWKILVALVVALLALVVGAVATNSSVNAGRSPNSGVTTVTFSAEDLQLTAFTSDSIMVNYPDGAHMVQWTYKWENTAGSTWDVNSYSIWNVPYSSGGHTDTMLDSCKFNYVSENMCTGGAGDGGTRVDWGMDNLSDNQTFWVRTWFKYGNTTYCRQIYGNNSGGTAWSYCTN